MPRTVVAALVLSALVLSGCAHVQVPLEGAFPFRAEFEGEAFIAGQSQTLSGAACINSASAGLAQLYGPGGLALYTIALEDGAIKVMDLWGSLLHTTTLPIKDGLGLLAGVPPAGAYLYQRTTAEGQRIVYAWGEVLLDTDLRPREMHVRRGGALDLYFRPEAQGIRLLIHRGSDTLSLQIRTVQGGRWMHAHHNM